MKIKKSVFVSSLVACSLLFGSIGAFAAGGVEKITAYLNRDMVFKIDGVTWTPKNANGTKVYPIVYDGTTYLPARAISEAVGADIAWNSSTQTLSISTSGSSTGGATTPSANTPSSSSKDSGTEITSTVVIYLPASFTPSSKGNELKSEAIKAVKLYADALKTGDTSKMNSYMETVILDKTYEYDISHHELSKENYKNKVDGMRKANDTSTINDYANALSAVTSSVLEFDVENAYKSDYSATLVYSFYPEDWDAFSSVYVYFNFTKLDDGRYALTGINVA
ncbi:stalk domain-containing protein [Paenibacillus sp. M1]|uniref:Stalk domain-containing protein n=1 Tax=Paenibacillus haidiansis TaxID=1574488 RepID=A0ABU7VXP9_9BACL